MKLIISLCLNILLFGFIHSIPVGNVTEDEIYEKEIRKAMENPNLFQGDILLGDDRNALPLDSQLWPNGVIPYVIDSSASSLTSVINQAVQHYNQYTCIKFRPRTNEANYVRIFRGQGCYSMLGRVGRGRQDLSLGQGCQYFSIAVHEMMHAVGFWHEHMRSDRDSYVEIHYNNIPTNLHPQFNKLAPNQNRLFTKFDFDSVMLYGPTAFSSNGQVTVSSKVQGKSVKNHPLNSGLSSDDIYSIKKLYKCK